VPDRRYEASISDRRQVAAIWFLFPPVSQPSRFGQVVIGIEYFVLAYVSVRLDTLFWAFSGYQLKNGFE
jgi:hypothetical protein